MVGSGAGKIDGSLLGVSLGVESGSEIDTFNGRLDENKVGKLEGYPL